MTDLSTLDELERAAKAATPGPWDVDAVMSEALHDVVLGYQVPSGGSPILVATVFSDEAVTSANRRPGDITSQEAARNAAHIAACNPTAILSLVAQVRQLVADAERRLGEWDDLWRHYPGRSCGDSDWNAWLCRIEAIRARKGGS